MRRLTVLMGAIALVASAATPVAAADPSGFRLSDEEVTQIEALTNLPKSPSGRLAQSDADLLARRDSTLIPVMVKLDFDAVASYTGGVQDLAPTSPEATNRSLDQNVAAVNAYTQFVSNKALAARRDIQRAVPAARIGRTFTLAYGGLSAFVPANQARELLGVEGVAAVQYDSVNQPLANDSPIFVGADQLWPKIGGSATAGQGVLVGVLDTGIWPEHPMLEDPGIPHPGGGPHACEFGLSGEAHDDAFSCNDKLIGAYAFLEANVIATGYDEGEYCTLAGCSARDANGHGTHTATTAAGSHVSSTPLLGVDRGPISGIAPGASIIAYRVCDADGCFQSDSVAAVEQSIADGVDVINFSISGGANAYTDPVELAFLDAFAAGITVNASAGNAGPGAATANHAGPWTITVGASTLNRAFETTLHLTADNGDTLDIPNGATVTDGIATPTEVVIAGGDLLCQADAPAGTFAGKIALCRRGVNARVEKGYNALQRGAVGMILYNLGATTDLATDNHWLPTVHVNDATGQIATFINDHSGVMASWAPGTAQTTQGDVMASFSSRGPQGDFIKPDVTAPGVQVLAGNSVFHILDPADGAGPNGEAYQAIAGTSMSSPHSAGVSALMKAAHPSWTPGQIKSALMTSSVQSVLKEDGSTPADPFDRGAGSIRANRAANPTVTFEATSADFFASASDPFKRIDLNIPSINANTDGVITTIRRARNVSGKTQTLKLSAKAPKGVKVTITPKKLKLNPGQVGSFTVRIDASKAANGTYFGHVKLDPKAGGYINALLPVVVNKTAGQVTFDTECDSTTFVKGQATACSLDVTNQAASEAHISVRVKGKNKKAVIKNFSDGKKKGKGFVWNGTLSAIAAPPIISFATASDSPAGYLPLSAFGVAPTAMGDEELINFNVPEFLFGDEVYNRLGVDSNGYVVVGGGTASDHSNSPVGLFPGPNRPNNVLAPYFTDLDPFAGGGVRIATLSDGINSYIVIDWEGVPLFSANQPRTFQVWIRYVGGEGIWFAYGSSMGAGDVNSGLEVGAENRDGSSAKTLGADVAPAANSAYKVVAGSPITGGSKTITFDVIGRKKGKWQFRSVMSSDLTQGKAKRIIKGNVMIAP